ncbi:MAG: prolyl aminopeptidase [Burkholderiales bacterium]
MYPPIEPYASGQLAVDSGHVLYWETCGNPRGLPALFLHGGPGGGCSTNDRRFFDPSRYRIVLLDQRGCGRSTLAGSLESNTTAHLIDDIETLREELNVDHWLLFGGSWGATLALAYAEQHPQRVSAMLLRGVFTARRSELDWLYRHGASHIYPEAWERFATFVPEDERSDLILAYHARLTSGNAALEAAAAREWCLWEDSLSTLLACPTAFDDAATRSLARIETHYFLHQAFFDEGQLLARAPRLRGIPGVIVQGRYDMVTPPDTAWQLHQAWTDSTLRMVPDAGHASSESGIRRELIAATDAVYRRISGRTAKQ